MHAPYSNEPMSIGVVKVAQFVAPGQLGLEVLHHLAQTSWLL